MSASSLARAKVNLFLHVTGRRADGYHTLDSLVAFAECGDRVSAEPSSMLSLSMEGGFAQSLDAGGDNLVLRAAMALQDAGRVEAGAALHLAKRLPVAAGLGGGSADAAAALRVLAELWGVGLPPGRMEALALTLGADVPVCLASRTRRMGGIGERLDEVAPLPRAWLLLVNPMRACSTAAVFSMLDGFAERDAVAIPECPDAAALGAWLTEETANDLQAPALRVVPEIGAILDALAGCEGVRLARMSGSGATCFGLFDGREAGLAAEARLRAAHRDWWLEAAPLAR